MKDPHERQQSDRGARVFLFIARALATSVEVFLHRSDTFGDRYLGPRAAAAILIIFVYPIFWADADPSLLLGFLGAYMLMLLRIRAAVIRRRARGELGEHSFYSGQPTLDRFTGRIAETTVKGVLEPMLVCALGALVGEFDAPLGSYLVVAGVGLLVSVQLTLAAERRRVLEMHDAYMEQRRIAEQWRRMRGE